MAWHLHPQEIFRTLKPGGMFACYEWCATDAYDPSDEQQKHIMSQIELGNGLPCVRTTTQVGKRMRPGPREAIQRLARNECNASQGGGAVEGL